jgi:hypothetical protein
MAKIWPHYLEMVSEPRAVVERWPLGCSQEPERRSTVWVHPSRAALCDHEK